MIDYMVIGLVVFFGIFGLVSGILLQGLRVVVACVAIWTSLTYSPVIAESVSFFQRSQMLRDYGLPIILFGVLYMLMALIVKYLVSMAAGDKGPAPASRVFGALAGGVLGLLLAYFIVSVGLSAQDASGRKMLALSNGKSHFVEFVQKHRPGELAGKSNRRELEVKIKEAANSIREGVKSATDADVEEKVDAVIEDAPGNQAP